MAVKLVLIRDHRHEPIIAGIITQANGRARERSVRLIDIRRDHKETPEPLCTKEERNK